MSALLELAERCEQATKPSYTLDCDIWDAIYPGERDARFEKLTSDGPYKGRLGPADRDGYIKPLRAFTASLDAAMTLVPEGMMFCVTNVGIEHPTKPDLSRASAIVGSPDDPNRGYKTGATPALALCAAALRARSA